MHTIPPEYIALISVALGATISILGNLFLSKKQAYLQIQNTLFLRRLEVYLKMLELLWPGGIKQHTHNSNNDNTFPIPYSSNKNLSEWLNSLTKYISANSILIDEQTLNHFKELNQQVLEDLKVIANNSTLENRDEQTRLIGLKSSTIIESHCTKIHNSGWDYFKNTYKVKL